MAERQRFADRTAIVTGAGGGIGEAYARALHAEGANVVIAELNEAAGQAVADSLGERTLFVPTDVGDPASTDAMAESTLEAFGRIDHLINNAAIFGDMELAGLTNVDYDYLNTFMSVNLMGALHCTRSVMRPMGKPKGPDERRGGSIVNQSSTAAWMGISGFYGLAKAGLNFLTASLAHELGHRNIRINAVAPGPTDTAAMNKQVPVEFQDPLVSSLAIKRLGTPADHVGPVLFLLSDEAAWMTGQIVAVDGGQGDPAVSTEPTTEMWHEERLLIDGELRSAEGGATYPVENPTTGGQLGEAADATPADVEAALSAARRAFDESGWATDVDLRVRCLRQLHQALVDHADQLTELTIAEVGAPRSACATVQLTAPTEFLPYYAELAEGYEWTTPLGVADTLGGPAERWTERNPIGVVAAITPWNVPHQINLAKIAPALAAGCTVVLKPAPETPWCGLALGRLVTEHTDIPAGVFNVVTSSDPAIGELLTGDPRVDMVSFTGSTATGRRVMAAASTNVTKVFLELGGKSASIVLDDVADFGLAAATAAFGTATVAGQGCALTTRVLLPRSRYDEGVTAIAEMMAAMAPGDPGDPGTMMGPLISDRQWQRVNEYVRGAEAAGARVVCGGGRPAALPDGHFFEMTLLADVTPDMAVASEEIFGPVLVAIAYEDDDDAVRIANDSIYGLSGAVFGADEQRAVAVGRRIRTGTMSINGGVWYGADVPFGGVKQSGIGREMGVAGFEEHLDTTAFARPAG